MMSIMTKVCMIIGFITTMVAMSTAENAVGEKFVFCIITGFAGLLLFGISLLFAHAFGTIDNQ